MIGPANHGTGAPVAPTRRALLALGLGLALQGLASPASAAGPASRGGARASGSSPVYLLRGFAGVFSAGIDEIGDLLRAAGAPTRIGSHLGWRTVADDIVRARAAGSDEPVVLIGHSLGANAAISVAEMLERHDIEVRYLASFAATAPDPLPGNVAHAENFYFSRDGWGLPLVAGPRFRGRLENRDFAGQADVGHFNIDKQPALQREVVQETLSARRRAA